MSDSTIDGTDAAQRAVELEAAADAVMEAKHLLVEMDRRNNLNREGFRALRKLQQEQREWRDARAADLAVMERRREDSSGVCAGRDGSEGPARIPPSLRSALCYDKARATAALAAASAKNGRGYFKAGADASAPAPASSPPATTTSSSGGGGGLDWQRAGLHFQPMWTAPAGTPNTGSGARMTQTDVWLLSVGGVFMRYSLPQAIDKLEMDKVETEREIELQRDLLKGHVAALAMLEGPESALARLNQGFHLNAVNKPHPGSARE